MNKVFWKFKGICKPRHWNWNWNWNWNWYYKRHYFELHNAYGPHTLQAGDLGWEDPIHKITRLFDIVVTWKMKSVISPFSQGLCTPNLGEWWLRMRESHPQSHMTHRPLGHVTTQGHYISTFIKDLWIPNLAGYWLLCVYYDRDLSRRKLGDASISLFQFYLYILSLSKKYNISDVKEAVGMPRKACACRK